MLLIMPEHCRWRAVNCIFPRLSHNPPLDNSGSNLLQMLQFLIAAEFGVNSVSNRFRAFNLIGPKF